MKNKLTKISRLLFAIIILSATGSVIFGQTEKPDAKMRPDGQMISDKHDLILQGKSDADGWKQYVSQNGGVKVSFPDAPETNVKPIKEGLFETESVQYLAEKNLQVFMMGFIDFKVNYSDRDFLDALFDGWQKGIEKNVPDSTVEQKNLEFNGNPARKVRMKNSEMTADGIVFFADKKMYHLLIFNFVAESEEAAAENSRLVQKFFDSFALESVAETENIYSNPSLKFSLTLPKDWIEISKDATSIIADFAKDNDKTISNTGKKQIDESLERTKVLFHYSKSPIGSATFIGALERNPNDSKITLYQIAVVSQQSFVKNLGYTIITPAKSTTINGTAFYMFDMKKQSILDETLYQRVYMKKSGIYLLEFVLTYKDEDSKRIMEGSLKTLKFTK